MIKVIMLSGGSESTGYLYQQLKESKDRIHVHHTVLINGENRYKVEDRVVKQIVEDARKIRNFPFTTSLYECPDCLGIGYFGYDIIKMGFTAGDCVLSIQTAMTNNGTFENMQAAICSSKTEIESSEAFKHDPRYLGAQTAFRSHFECINYEEPFKAPELIFPLLEIETKDVLEYVPSNIRKILISCRKPVSVGDEYIPCGLCHSCRKMGVINGLK